MSIEHYNQKILIFHLTERSKLCMFCIYKTSEAKFSVLKNFKMYYTDDVLMISIFFF